MTFPVSGPTTTDLVRAVVEVTHEALKRAETAEAEQEKQRKRADDLDLGCRALQDRLRERDETIARQGREQTDSDRVVKGLREAATPFRSSGRPHHGPPIRCWCGMTHSHEQATALNAAPPGAAVVDNVADELVREAKELPKDSKERVMVTADWLFGLAGRLRAAVGRDRIEAKA